MTGNGIEFLKNLPVFQSLKLADIKRLADKALFVAYRKGDMIVSENQRDDAFYVVVSGRCQAFTRLKSGATRVVTNYCSGDCFGEIALLAGELYWYRVKCLNDAVLLKILREDFDQTVRSNPEVVMMFNQIFQDRIRFLREEKKKAKWSSIFALYGIRAGVGKALVSSNLAASLHAETREPVLVVDMNGGGSSLSLEKFEAMANWACTDLSALAIKHPAGYHVLRIGLEGTEAEADRIASFFGCLVKRYDYVLVDLPHEISPPVLQCFVQCDEAFLITGKEEENLYHSRLFLRDLEHQRLPVEEKVRIILTRAAADTSNGVDAVARHLGSPIHAHLTRLSSEEQKSSLEDRPFVLAKPVHSFSLVITRLAREIGNVRVGLALGSGAARGLAHIGVIRVLEQEGIIV